MTSVHGQWVVCYRLAPHEDYRVYASAYTVEQVQASKDKCWDTHAHADVWCSPSSKVPYPGGDDVVR